jgi:hypothetical protein
MPFPLRTLSQVHNIRRASGGKLGAELIAVCDTCGSKWRLNLEVATRELGENATAEQLVGAANCPHCSGGVCSNVPYLVVDDRPMQRPIYFPGLFDKYLDTVDVYATDKPRKPRR